MPELDNNYFQQNKRRAMATSYACLVLVPAHMYGVIFLNVSITMV